MTPRQPVEIYVAAVCVIALSFLLGLAAVERPVVKPVPVFTGQYYCGLSWADRHDADPDSRQFFSNCPDDSRLDQQTDI